MRELAEKIYEELKNKGVDIGNASIAIIQKVIEDYDMPEWKKLAINGKREEAIKSLWKSRTDGMNVSNVVNIVESYMEKHIGFKREK